MPHDAPFVPHTTNALRFFCAYHRTPRPETATLASACGEDILVDHAYCAISVIYTAERWDDSASGYRRARL